MFRKILIFLFSFKFFKRIVPSLIRKLYFSTAGNTILLNDKGAKTNLSIDFYKKNGFKVINETKNQILFSKK